MKTQAVSRKSFLKSILLGALALTFIPRLFSQKQQPSFKESLPLKTQKEPRSIPSRLPSRTTTIV